MKSQYLNAKEKYARIGVDIGDAISVLKSIPISIHCWQGDDVNGFENIGQSLSGGIQATGNYFGKARTPDELMADFDKAISLIPGKKRINLHASYAIFDGEPADRDNLKPEHFTKWVCFAKKKGLGIDFNSTYFSHPKAKDGLTLSHPDPKIREFWINHGVSCRRIAAFIAKELNTYCLHNVWIPDGLKDIPADRLSPRLRLKDSLDQIFSEKFDNVIDSVESKVFGIGLESYTVGSNEFYMSYAAGHNSVYNLLDNGHYHPNEKVSDKIASLLAFFDKVPLHITRSVHWDSDHVVLFDDETKEIANEIIRNDAADKVLIGLDFFDASINRVAAWVVGARSVQKALLNALLHPWEYLKKLQDNADFTELMVLREELKTYPFSEVWTAYCEDQNVPANESWLSYVKQYEQDVLQHRNSSPTA
ncbi:MAG: L-rhamnose isomerase [Clostridiales bacterium]|jgi:L-rhamnose isomerase|nr:L-rhamnose isomerase [Clostridiales bacterium]